MKLLVVHPRPRDGVARKWKDQYCQKGTGWQEYGRAWNGRTKQGIYDALMALPQDASPDAVDAAIGNKTWTRHFCSACNEYADRAVEFGETYSGAIVCEPCLRLALEMVRPSSNEDERHG